MPSALDAHAARDDLRIGEDLGDVVDRPAGNARRGQSGEQLVAAARAIAGASRAIERVAIADPAGIGREPCRRAQAEQGAEPLELARRCRPRR